MWKMLSNYLFFHPFLPLHLNPNLSGNVQPILTVRSSIDVQGRPMRLGSNSLDSARGRRIHQPR